jgi:hypothetical protein
MAISARKSLQAGYIIISGKYNMTKEFVTRYILKGGVLQPLKVGKKEAFREVHYILKRDRKITDALKNL